jgi:hypothetical protein
LKEKVRKLQAIGNYEYVIVRLSSDYICLTSFLFVLLISADGDRFGFVVALSGDATRFVVGAPFSRAASSDAGRVQVYEV